MKKLILGFLLTFVFLILVGCGSNPEVVDNRLTVSFDTDGGSPISELKLDKDQLISMNEVSRKDGYTFVTWVLENHEFDFTTPVTSDITLKAIWVKEIDEETEAIVYFNTEGGSYVAPVVVNIGETITEPNQPEKLGYTFKYWVDEYDEKRFLFSTEIEGETYLKAYYEARKKLTLKFDTNGGEALEDTFVYSGDAVGELPKPVKEGFLFLGWYYNGSKIDDKFIPSISCTLKASYAEIGDGYKTVTFYNYDGTLIEKQKVEMGQAAVSPTATKTGYTFKSWDKDISFIYEDIETTAQFEINHYLVQFKDTTFNKVYSNQDVIYLNDAVAPYVEDKEGMIFVGWDKTFINVTEDIVVNAIWSTSENLNDEGKIEHTINVLNHLYNNDASGTKLDLYMGETDLGTSILWKSLNTKVINHDGTITRCFEKTTVTLEAEIISGSKSKTVTYEYIVPRTTKDLSNGLTAAYLYSATTASKELIESAYDVYYLAFASFNSDGIVTSLGEMGSDFVKNSIDAVHARGCYVIPSFRTTDTFIAVATNVNARKKFASSIVELINKYDLDGVDIDWEVPRGTEQIDGFVEMMKEIYTKVKANNPKHLVTCAILLGGVANFRLNKSGQYMDYLNLMCYEMHSHERTTHHAALYPSSKGGTLYATSTSVAEVAGYGIPYKKIVIGAAFFGRQYLNSKGIGTTATYQEAAPRYATIKNYVENQTATCKRYWDNECKAPYIYDSETGLFISYDDPESIGCKFDYVVSKKLAGIMCWQTGQDNGDLTQAFVDNYSKIQNRKL